MDGNALSAAPAGKSRKLHILTWGCQMNEYDSARMADLLAPLGYGICPSPDEADLVILNTCHIREKAAEKVFSELGRLHARQKERAGAKALIAVAGCVAQAEGAEIRARMPFVDVVVGPQAYHRLPEMITRATREKGGVVDTSFPAESKFDFLPDEHAPRGVSAFLPVQEGCDKFCTFCVVPYTRGAEASRPVAKIMEEARRLLQNGAREITLLGQNVNAWHGEGPDGKGWSLGRLIREMAGLDGLLRLRYTTSHPRDMDADLIAAHRDVPQLAPFVHLPVQSGSGRILRAMNRGHTAADYLGIIERLRKARPDIAFSSDFIVGFPGETARDFEDTLALARAVNYAQAYSFKYSARPGTPAAGMKDQVPDDVRSARLRELQSLLSEQQRAFNRSFVGKTLPVLFDRAGRQAGQVLGRSPFMQAVVASSDNPPDFMADVIITSATQNSLQGDLCASLS